MNGLRSRLAKTPCACERRTGRVVMALDTLAAALLCLYCDTTIPVQRVMLPVPSEDDRNNAVSWMVEDAIRVAIYAVD